MNRTILFQLTAPSLLIGLLLFLACLVSAWYINQLQADISRVLAKNVESLVAAQQLEISLRQLRFHCFLYAIQPDPRLLEEIAQNNAAFEDALERAERAVIAPEESVYLEAIEQGYQDYRGEFQRMRAEVDRNGPRQDFLRLADAHPVRHIVEPCRQLVTLNEQMMAETFEDHQRLSRWLGLILLLLGLGGPLSGIIAGYGVARGLTRSIYQLSVRVQDMAQHLEQEVGSVRLSPAQDIKNLDGQLKHVVDRVAEVTQRLRRQEQEMLRTEQLAALGQLAAGLAHEVRNPLMSVKLLIESALRSEGRRGLNQRDLEVIHRELARLEQTLQDFLDFARPPALRRQQLDLREPIHAVLALVKTRARQQQVAIVCDLPPEPVLLEVDRDQFQTVLINLFLNALDAMPQGGTLKVRLRRDESEGIVLCLTDTGPGIPEEILPRLFTPFVSSKPTGTGLGLSLSQRIVQEHGGLVTAHNLPEGGACFRIVLPTAPSEVAHADAVSHR
ncbi:MAG: ATP-binding protein [Gemmatales bacterium]|nr:ATP-binding protein [Gemmatales bacterium]MDW8386745.1 ATP-binding protein [Gemmatales bacterium]